MWTAFASTAVTSSMFLTALGPNLLALGLVRQATAIDITWSQWSLGFLPVGLLLIAPLPLARLPDLSARDPIEPGSCRLGEGRAGPDGKTLDPGSR